MLDAFLSDPLWPVLAWAGLSLLDLAGTMLYSRFYRDHLSRVITYEGGMEMNPAFEKDVQQVRWFSPRYIFSMLAVAAVIYVLGAWLSPAFFEFLSGMVLLMVLAVDLRHIENLSVVRLLLSDPAGFKGRIEQSYALSQRRVAVSMVTTALLYLIVFLLVGRVFFAGGAVICILAAARHFMLAGRLKRAGAAAR